MLLRRTGILLKIHFVRPFRRKQDLPLNAPETIFIVPCALLQTQPPRSNGSLRSFFIAAFNAAFGAR